MKEPITPIELRGLKRYSLAHRKSLVDKDTFSIPHKLGQSFWEWFNGLPHILAAKDLREVVFRIKEARDKKRPVILGMGAHPIKVGLGPLIISLMEADVITSIAMNGACIIHDTEIAMYGHTSEDVQEALRTGEFGMALETSQFINQAISEGYKSNLGLGEAICKALKEASFPYKEYSILSQAALLEVPVTVHVALGTDIIHMGPEARGDAIGSTSLLDFRRFCTLVAELEGGVYINLGSAVILPEVFLKAVTVARNLGHTLDHITTVTMDFNRHYRANTNVCKRPTSFGGKGYYLIGHHEIMFPLMAAAILELMEARK